MRNEHDLPWLAEPLAALRDASRGHALILHGGAGAGLLELALRLAQAWLCEQPPGPCDQCPSCHLALARTHPDLKVVLPETVQQALNWHGGEGDADGGDGESKGKRKPSKDIKVEAVRQAIDWAHSSSGRGRGKVLVFFPADAMNTVAANALLKTLEEPGQGVRLILAVDDPERLLPTIRSRCQRQRLQPPSLAEAGRWLKAQGVADAEVLLSAAGGQPLAAEQLAAAGITAAVWNDLPQQVARGDARLLSSWSPPEAVRALQQICHDASAVAVGAAPRFFDAPALARLQPSLDGLVAWSQALTRAARHDEHPWNAALLIESLVGQGRQALTGAAARR